MTSLIALITKSTLLKWVFGYSFYLSSFALIEQQFTNKDFFNDILNAVPSKFAVALGIIYGSVILLSKISNAWKEHQINKTEVSIHKVKVKEAEELLEQQELNTDEKRKNLES